MTEPEDPLVRLPDKALCIKHFHALIPQQHPSGILWQTRYTLAMAKIAELMMEHHHVKKQCNGHVEWATAIIAQCVPLCCFLGPAALTLVQQEIDRSVDAILRHQRNPEQ